MRRKVPGRREWGSDQASSGNRKSQNGNRKAGRAIDADQTFLENVKGREEICVDIAVLGGGASGMMAAIAATGIQDGAEKNVKEGQILILEHKDKLGKKLYATGNGRCNFTNEDMSLSNFRGERELVRTVLGRFGKEEAISFFQRIGVYPKEKNGYYYPASLTAASVVEALERELQRLGVLVMNGVQVSGIAMASGGRGSKNASDSYAFLIETSEGRVRCKRLIIATGLLASPKLGSDGSAMDLVKGLGHRFTKVVPALCGFCAEGMEFKAAAGVRVEGAVSVYVEAGTGRSEEGVGRLALEEGLGRKAEAQESGSVKSGKGLARRIEVQEIRRASPDDQWQLAAQDRGELQMTDYGISGIPVFQVSRYASKALLEKKRVMAELDLFPEMEEAELEVELARRIKGGLGIGGLINKKLFSSLCIQMGLDKRTTFEELELDKAGSLAAAIKHCRISLIRPRGFEQAQVCAGGLRSGEVDRETLESRIVKNLYFCGEILDVDGVCGGYNLQWAWSSGYVAGRSASNIN